MSSGKASHFLIIDRHADLRAALTYLLSAKGYRVTEAADMKEAAEVFKTHGREIDLIILDPITLPKTEESSFLGKAEEGVFHPPLILLMSEENDLYLSQSYSEYVETVLTKPFSTRQFWLAVERSLKLRQYRSGDNRKCRRQSRVDIELPIEIVFEGHQEVTKAVMTNFSSSGCFVTWPGPSPEAGTRFKFRIFLQDPWLLQVRGDGVVRWKRPDEAGPGAGCGLEFVNLPDSAKIRLLRLVNHFKTL